MRSAIALSVTGRGRKRQLHGCVVRIAVTTFALVAMLVAGTGAAAAQEGPESHGRWEFVAPGGLVLPTGEQASAIKRGGLTAVQLSYVVNPVVAVMATVGWGRSRDVALEGQPKLDLFTYDVGAEFRAPRLVTHGRASLTPFAGLGAGARSYNYRHLDVDATHNLAAYGSVGGDVGIGRVHLRFEARDYVTGFKPLTGAGGSDARNDVALLFGIRLGAR